MPSVPTGDAARAIGPGFAGFVATALLVIVVIFLIRDMVRRIRRVRYTAQAEERQRDLVERGRSLQQDDDEALGADGPRRAGDGGTPADRTTGRDGL
jgi:hypothetical protein